MSKIVVSLQISENAFSFSSQTQQYPTIAFHELRSVQVERGLIFDDFIVNAIDTQIRIQGLGHKKSNQFYAQIQQACEQWLLGQWQQFSAENLSFNQLTESLLASEQYLSQYFIRSHIQQWPEIGAWLAHPFFRLELLPASEQAAFQRLASLQNPESTLLVERNRQFVSKEIEQIKPELDGLEAYPLTQEQLTAVVTDEDRNLLIASAGSGKSSTLVAKVVYLLKKGFAKPQEIALLAYNDEASQSIRQRLVRVLGEALAQQIQISTFHALGLEIISRHQGFKPRIVELAQGGNRGLIEFFQYSLNELSLQDSEFHQAWLEYLALYKKPRPPLFSIQTLHQYYDYLLQIGAKYHTSKNGKRRPVFTCLNGLQVTSLEAQMIANWLCLHGISFQYHRSVDLGDGRKAQPADFYYPEIALYHDHFAINSAGKRPVFLENYDEYLAQKQNIVKSYEFKHLVTTSADFESGEIFPKLKQALIAQGLQVELLPLEQLQTLLEPHFNPFEDLSIFCSFLQHFKANGGNLTSLNDKIQILLNGSQSAENFEAIDNSEDQARMQQIDRLRTASFMKIFGALYQAYQNQLNQYNGIDFNDQINQACMLLERREWQHPYRYVLVDEFQDISQDRKRLLKALLDQNPQTKLLAVGDDWQSIYRFSGADIDIMTHFANHFGVTATNYLTQTFRCYQGIADVASKFVQKNPEQLQKNVKAHANIKADQVLIEAYSSQTEHNNKLLSILDKLNRLGIQRQIHVNVYLLARYHRLKPNNLGFLQQRFTALNIEFKTIHGSKGLEADYVILLNMESGTYGFPSTVSDDSLLHLVIPQIEHFEHAEERRLFYVALTRAKRGVFILSNSVDTSSFVNELLEFDGVKASESLLNLDVCPKCAQGKMQERQGKFGIFWGCNLYPACDHTEKCYCPDCEIGTLVAKESEHGKFYGCSTYPECKYIHERGKRKLKYYAAPSKLSVNKGSSFRRIK